MMKRRHLILAGIAAILTVAVLTLILPVFSGRIITSAFASDGITTPTDLDMEPAWTSTISDGDNLAFELDIDDFGLLTLTPTVSGIYTFSAPNGATPNGGLVNITLYDASGEKIYLYDNLTDALNENTLFGYEYANLYNMEPLVILEHGETIRIAVRINWTMTYNDPADNQDFTISLSCIPTEGTCGDNLNWTLDLNTQTLTVTGSGPMDNYASLGQAPWCACGNMFQHVVLEGATSIGDRAFATTGITDISIPDTVQSIGRSVFNMTGLQEVTIRSHVTEIDPNAFDGTQNLTVFCEVGSAALEVAKAKKINYTYIPFINTLTIPADTVTIASKAFANLGEHVNIAIPAGTTSIALDAFDESVVLLLVAPGSPAESWAETNEVPYICVE